MNTRTTIEVAKDFSPSPAGRFLDDGPYTGELFRDNFLLPPLKANKQIIVDLKGTELPGSSFLEEAFGGLVRAGLSEDFLKTHLMLVSPRSSDEIRIWKFIHLASKQKQ